MKVFAWLALLSLPVAGGECTAALVGVDSVLGTTAGRRLLRNMGRLWRHFGNGSFSSGDAASLLGVNKMSADHYVNRGIVRGLITVAEGGYRFVPEAIDASGEPVETPLPIVAPFVGRGVVNDLSLFMRTPN